MFSPFFFLSHDFCFIRFQAQDAASSKQGVGKLIVSQQKRKRKTQQQGGKGGNLFLGSLTMNLKPLSCQQRGFVLEHRCFLLRNLDKVRDWRDRQKDRLKQQAQRQQNPTSSSRTRRFITKSEPLATTTPAPKDPSPPQPSVSMEQKPTADLAPIQQPPLLSVFVTEEESAESSEEVVRCRCRLFDDEGLMVQCERCETWQHSECLGRNTSADDLDAEHYICHSCAGQPLRREDLNIVLVPQPESVQEGQTFYLSLVYKDLQIRQGDCVYVLRDHDTPDSERTLWSGIQVVESELPTPRPPHHLPAHLKPANLDIFQIERIWIDESGKAYVWGHHFFRPQDTFHEPTRKFYVNELLYSPIQEAIPLWAVAGRCWVLDPTTFCKGRPIDAVEEHVYITEHRVDRTARLFSKNSRSKFPVCTRRFAFRSFVARLKPQRTFQPHGAPPTVRRKGGATAETPAAQPGKGGKKKKEDPQAVATNPAVPTVASKHAQAQIKVLR